MGGSGSRSTWAAILIAVTAILTTNRVGNSKRRGRWPAAYCLPWLPLRGAGERPVFNLAAHPRTCVRFDRHAVYLGRPGASESCPSSGAGRTTEAMLIEPWSGSGSARVQLDPVTHLVTATAPGIKITALYGTDPVRIRQITLSASLPAPVTFVPRPKRTTSQMGEGRAAAAASIGPGSSSFTGQGFDACTAPSQANMNAWKSDSPYSAIGIYLGGSERACAQPDLTSGWVSTQASAGWHFIPLWVGPQAEFSQLSSPASQATSNANAAVSAAQALGLGPGTPLYYDMEAYTHSQQSASSVLTFESTWTDELHALGYRSGIYSSSGSGIADLVANFNSYTMPDVIDDALWNGQANTADSTIPSTDWADHQRVHQFSGGVIQTYGGFQLNIDQDYLDVDVTGIPALAGGPSVYDPGSGKLEVYGTGTNGALWQDAWKPVTGWSGWLSLGGSISGTPSAIFDPLTKHLEVYVRGAGGPLFQKYWNPSTGSWSGWIDLGGSITGSPAAIYDPADNTLGVYVRGAKAPLFQISWVPGSGWSGWLSLGGAITGSAAGIYDPASGNPEVYAVATDATLFEAYHTASGWHTADLGGSLVTP